MKIINNKSILLFSSIAILASCNEDPIENELTNCQFATSVFINDDAPIDGSPEAVQADNDNPPFLDEQEIEVCGRSPQELQQLLDKLASDNEELTTLFNTQNPPVVDPPVVDPPVVVDQGVVIPAGQPAVATTGFTITFDEMSDFTFGMDNSANTFSNEESAITAEVTAGDVPATPSDAALKVDLTPSNTSGGFYFAGTILDITDLGLEAIDFSGDNKSITANVYSEVPVGFRVQVSNAEGEVGNRDNVALPTPGFKDGQHSGSGWEQITIDFSNGVNTIFGLDGVNGGQPQSEPIDGVYNRIQFQFEALPLDVLSTIFVDNVNYPDVAGDVVIEEPVVEPMEPVGNDVVIEFDEMGNDYTVGEGNDSTFAFSNEESSIVVSVATSNIPTDGNRTGSGNAIQVDLIPSNTSGGFYFAGLGYDLTDYPFDEIDFTGANKSITFNVYSTVPFGFRVQVSDTAGEAGNRSSIATPPPGFKDGAHGGTGWEEITIDFTSGVNTIFGLEGIDGGQTQTQELNGEYSRIQLQFENLPLDTPSTIYFDNVRYN